VGYELKKIQMSKLEEIKNVLGTTQKVTKFLLVKKLKSLTFTDFQQEVNG
jgi:hypothetical protein